MSKAYWITFYRRILEPAALETYARLAGPAILAGGGRFLARGAPTQVFEQGLAERVTIVEFDSLEQAFATHDGPGYRSALEALGHACERDVRVIEGPRSEAP